LTEFAFKTDRSRLDSVSLDIIVKAYKNKPIPDTNKL